jgi:hypothetical protein
VSAARRFACGPRSGMMIRSAGHGRAYRQQT